MRPVRPATKGAHPMKQHLKPGDFRADLPADEIEQLNQVETRAAMNDQIGLEMSWGMQMQARGFDPNLMFEPPL